MPFKTTHIDDLLIFEPQIFEDKRGYFFEAFNNNEFKKNNLPYNFVQDNQSYSQYGVIRGLHYQTGEYAQSKLVRVLQGTILDIAVDLRKKSPTFKQIFAIKLSASNKLQLLIPTGFAHGFSVLSETAEVMYKCDNFYNKESERGIKFNDEILNINWEIERSKQIVADKDLLLPTFNDATLF